jgi:hypothetical protein
MSAQAVVARPIGARGAGARASQLIAIPVRTRLISAGDDLVATVVAAVDGIARPGDVLAVSETAVAIAQGQAIAAETIRPSRLAYAMARRSDPLATVNQPESLQLVIDRVGVWKVLFAGVMHVAGRLAGRRGLFYEILGSEIAALDGYTGTLPPFERTIVFAPLEPDRVATEIAARTAVACAIVDANDLGRAKVLGASPGIDVGAVEQALQRNPHGNGDEQTPIVVLAWHDTGTSPLIAGVTAQPPR